MSASADIATPLADRPVREQEIVTGLLRGVATAELAWAVDGSADDVLDQAHRTLDELAPTLAEPLGTDIRHRVGEYLLDRQTPGQAAGTFELLRTDADARRWAIAVREALRPAYGALPAPALPGIDAGDGPVHRSRRAPQPTSVEQQRRDVREHRRQNAAARHEAQIEVSPFRREAIEAHSASEGRVRLPHYASRPTRISLYCLLGLLVVGLVFAGSVKVPVHTQGRALVADVKDGQPGPLRGLSVIAIFPAHTHDEIHSGEKLSIKLPGTADRVSTRIAWVADHVMSPHDVVHAFGLDKTASAEIRHPATVAIAQLKVPPGGGTRASFEGAVTDQTNVKTGTKTVLGLL